MAFTSLRMAVAPTPSVKELNAAKESVLVQAYSFTSAPIAKALLEAHKRGVKVQVILDKSQRTRSTRLRRSCKTSHSGLHRRHTSTPSPTTRSWSSTAHRSHGIVQFHEGGRGEQTPRTCWSLTMRSRPEVRNNWQEHLEHSVPSRAAGKGGTFIGQELGSRRILTDYCFATNGGGTDVRSCQMLPNWRSGLSPVFASADT